MTDRLTNIIVGLQRLGEEARLKGDDIRYSQRQEDAEHLKYLRELLAIVQRVHSILIDETRKFIPPAEEARPEQLNKLPEPPPKFLQQGKGTP
jgi:hypothetical protein